MFAVVKTGGRQFRVAPNDIILVHKLEGEAGSSLELDHVLLVSNENGTKVGSPVVAGAKVTATIVDQTRAEKVIIFKKTRRHTYRRKKGHRQDLTVLRITNISA